MRRNLSDKKNGTILLRKAYPVGALKEKALNNSGKFGIK